MNIFKLGTCDKKGKECAEDGSVDEGRTDVKARSHAAHEARGAGIWITLRDPRDPCELLELTDALSANAIFRLVYSLFCRRRRKRRIQAASAKGAAMITAMMATTKVTVATEGQKWMERG